MIDLILDHLVIRNENTKKQVNYYICNYNMNH